MEDFSDTPDATSGPSATATLLLADSAQVADGKLYLLGAGWDRVVASPMTSPSAVAVIVEVPSDRSEAHLGWALQLVDEDGHPVQAPGTDAPLADIRGGLTIMPEADGVPGMSWPAPLAVNMPPLPLTPGRYAWRFDINDVPVAQRAFTVHPPI
jgi:hypothetical protein